MDLVPGGFNNASAGLYPAWNLIQDISGGSGGFNRIAIDLVSTGTPTMSRQFRWPTNWDNAQPVNVLLSVGERSFNTGTYQLKVSLACDAAATDFTSLPSYGTAAGTGLINSPNGHISEVTLSSVGTQSCSPGSLASIMLIRDNSSGTMSSYVSLAMVSLQYSIK
jgi:hypothetical protein